MAVEYRCCGTDFFIRIIVVIVLVLFAGLMSGLTLGLMSMSLVDLEVLAKSGTPTDSKHACTAFSIQILSALYKTLVLLQILPSENSSNLGFNIYI